MSTPDSTATPATRNYPLTNTDKAAIAVYCALKPERIIALHEGVLVRDVPRTASAFAEFLDAMEPVALGPAYTSVEVIYTRRSGAIAAVRHAIATAEDFLAAAHRYAGTTPAAA